MDCFTSLHVVSSAVRNERRMSSNVAGSKRLVRRRGLNTEGAFRSWLLRVLIDEAVVVLRRTQEEERGHDTLGAARGPDPAVSRSIAGVLPAQKDSAAIRVHVRGVDEIPLLRSYDT